MGARPRRSDRPYSPRMMDSNSNGRDEPPTDVVPGAAVSPERWLSGALAGAATLIGILVAIGTAVVWIFALDPVEMFGRL